MTIKTPADIANLPWVGNFFHDADKFRQCDQFIRSATDREDQKQALHLMGLHGMGLDEPVTDAVLEEYLTSVDLP